MPSIQWTITAGFLYAEILFIILLLLPIISPKSWKNLFNSSLFKRCQKKANHFFLFFIITLSILLLDAIREILKYGEETEVTEAFNFNMQQGREFRAQRNLYITGIALFLTFVIKRLIVLLTKTADLLEDIDFLKSQITNIKKESEMVKTKQVDDEVVSRPAVQPSAPPNPNDVPAQVRSRSKAKKDL